MEKRKPKTPKKINKRYLTNSGLYYLQKFTASTGHFRFIMMRKINKSCKHHEDQNLEECEKLLDEVIEDFVKVGHLNDPAYCTGMVISMRKRGLSHKAIMMKLGQKRLPSDMIKSALDDIDEIDGGDEDPDLRAAMIFARRKRLGPFMRADKITENTSPEDIEKIKNRALGSLARAGFSFSIAKRVLDNEEV